MLNKKVLLFIGICAFFTACQSKPSSQSSSESLPAGVHKGIVVDLLQTSNYTYLQLKEDKVEQWVAVPAMQAKNGDVYYYKGGLTMSNFESKELKRTFDNVLFLEKVSTDTNFTSKPPTAPAGMDTTQNATAGAAGDAGYTRTAPVIEKKEVKITPAKDGVTIANLFSKKESFAGKTVKVKGEVTKFTPAVMGKNWIHLQDGTESNNKFDLVVTSETEVAVGDQITAEGKISLNKDLGYGYFFEVIMEDASIKK